MDALSFLTTLLSSAIVLAFLTALMKDFKEAMLVIWTNVCLTRNSCGYVRKREKLRKQWTRMVCVM